MADNKRKITISPQAFLAISLHASCHSTTVVHGLLVGSQSDNGIMVEHAFPICHETPTRPLLDTALALVKSELSGDTSKTIVGWFTSPEILSVGKADPVAMRIAANMATDSMEPVLLVLQSENLGKLVSSNGITASECIQAFGKDFGKQWLEPLEVTVLKETNTTEITAEVIREGFVTKDLVDHWQDGSSSQWQHSVNMAAGPLEKYFKKLNV